MNSLHKPNEVGEYGVNLFPNNDTDYDARNLMPFWLRLEHYIVPEILADIQISCQSWQ